MNAKNVATLGQVFTPDGTVEFMLGLSRNGGRWLEPSCGNGAFTRHLPPGGVAIELDARWAPPSALNMDFFAYSADEKFDRIVGNPPYVKARDIRPETRALLASVILDGRANLYLHFIEKALSHLSPGGELIFIVPRDFIKATSARKLNERLWRMGTITDFVDLGDARIFAGAVPNCAIFRFERDRFDRTMNDGRRFHFHDGQLLFLSGDFRVPFSDMFSVKVGAVSGADHIFEHPQGNLDFVCSKTIDTGETRRMIYNSPHPHLVSHRETLLRRRIRRFHESNWWQWGRGYHVTDSPRIYVNGKTRRKAPFFVHDCRAYDGSVLAIFPKRKEMDVRAAADALNAVPWEEMGFVCDGRYLFSQRSLETCLLPVEFEAMLASGS